MKKKIGKKNIIGDNGTSEDTPLWISFFEYNDTLFASIYFTESNSPRNKNWFTPLSDIGFKIISKGNYRYGYYYKIICSKPLDKIQPVLDKLKEFNEIDLDGDENSFEIDYTIEEIYNKYISEKL